MHRIFKHVYKTIRVFEEVSYKAKRSTTNPKFVIWLLNLHRPTHYIIAPCYVCRNFRCFVFAGILLYGPPGTGKTLLAKALACETETTFINLTSSSFVSKWRGESEKMIKVLFDVATYVRKSVRFDFGIVDGNKAVRFNIIICRYYAPSTIFVDEIDAVAYRHDDTHHDASRRFKSELLTQLDGILTSSQQILVLASTNSPWYV